jgi:hypothetical protein
MNSRLLGSRRGQWPESDVLVRDDEDPSFAGPQSDTALYRLVYGCASNGSADCVPGCLSSRDSGFRS